MQTSQAIQAGSLEHEPLIIMKKKQMFDLDVKKCCVYSVIEPIPMVEPAYRATCKSRNMNPDTTMATSLKNSSQMRRAPSISMILV